MTTTCDPRGLLSGQRTIHDVRVRFTYADGTSVTESVGPGLAYYMVNRWTRARFAALGSSALCYIEREDESCESGL